MGSYDVSQQRVVDACRALIDKGFLSGTGGNVSVRVVGAEAMAITPSNVDYQVLSPGDICVVDWNLTPLECALKPSVESGMHAAVYQTRPDVGAVVHTHQPYASAVALTGKALPALFDEQVRFLGRSVEIVPYAPSGTGLLKSALAKKILSGNNAYILQNHGAVCFGASVERAIFNVLLLEKVALCYLITLCAGEKAHTLNPLIREIIMGKLRKDEARTAELFQRGEELPEGQQAY